MPVARSSSFHPHSFPSPTCQLVQNASVDLLMGNMDTVCIFSQLEVFIFSVRTACFVVGVAIHLIIHIRSILDRQQERCDESAVDLSPGFLANRRDAIHPFASYFSPLSLLPALHYFQIRSVLLALSCCVLRSVSWSGYLLFFECTLFFALLEWLKYQGCAVDP